MVNMETWVYTEMNVAPGGMKSGSYMFRVGCTLTS
jgi:hypothetical protein